MSPKQREPKARPEQVRIMLVDDTTDSTPIPLPVRWLSIFVHTGSSMTKLARARVLLARHT